MSIASQSDSRTAGRALVIHPLLVAAFPALFLYAENVREVSLAMVATPLAASVAAAAALWALLGLMLRNARKAAIIVSLLFLLFFSFGHAVQVLPPFTWDLSVVRIGRKEAVLALWALILPAGSWLVVRSRSDLHGFTRFLDAATGVLVLMSVFNVVTYEIRGRSRVVIEPDERITATRRPERLPDIYWIVADSYGRADVLKELYDYDNRGFISFLRSRGFYVADKSTSNYMWTHLSLPSMIHMDYMDRVMPAGSGEFTEDRLLATQAFTRNPLTAFLKRERYTTIAFASGIASPHDRGFDEYLVARLHTEEAPKVLLGMTPAGMLHKSMDADERQREQIRQIFQGFADLVNRASPKLVFAHIMLPHRPFIFGRNGESVSAPHLYLPTGVTWLQTQEQIDEYRRRHVDQVIYLNEKLEETIDLILEESDPRPVIILHGDHGPLSLMAEPDEPSDDAMRERFPILNSLYLPDGNYDEFSSDVTLVNSFRMILNNVFGTGLTLHENRSFFSTTAKTYEFTDVTAIARGE